MDTITVLMSTYNGEKYIREQIDSILNQQDVEIELFIRDDGSTDKTKDIIEEYTHQENNIFFFDGDNIGVGNSFLSVLIEAKTRSDYYAFADQDDVWLPEKLKRAIDILKGKRGPSCYCSNQILVDSNGEFERIRHVNPIDTSYMHILCNNEVTGCTMVWNKELQVILTNTTSKPSQELLNKRIHDVWVAMVASVVGKIYYDHNPYIMYRQHENNVVGAKKEKKFNIWKKKLKNPKLRNGRSALAREIIEKIDNSMIDKMVYDKLTVFAYYNRSLRYRAIMLKDHDICNYSEEDMVTYRLKVLFGLL